MRGGIVAHVLNDLTCSCCSLEGGVVLIIGPGQKRTDRALQRAQKAILHIEEIGCADVGGVVDAILHGDVLKGQGAEGMGHHIGAGCGHVDPDTETTETDLLAVHHRFIAAEGSFQGHDQQGSAIRDQGICFGFGHPPEHLAADAKSRLVGIIRVDRVKEAPVSIQAEFQAQVVAVRIVEGKAVRCGNRPHCRKLGSCRRGDQGHQPHHGCQNEQANSFQVSVSHLVLLKGCSVVPCSCSPVLGDRLRDWPDRLVTWFSCFGLSHWGAPPGHDLPARFLHRPSSLPVVDGAPEHRRARGRAARQRHPPHGVVWKV